MPNIFLQRFMIAPAMEGLHCLLKRTEKMEDESDQTFHTVRLLSTVVSTHSDDICENLKCIHILR